MNGYRGHVRAAHNKNYPPASYHTIRENGRVRGGAYYRPPPTENEVRAYARQLEKSVDWHKLQRELEAEPWQESIAGTLYRDLDIGLADIPDLNQEAYVKAMRDVYADHGHIVLHNEGGYGWRIVDSLFDGDD